MMEDLKIKWEEMDNNDYVAYIDNIKLRVEKMNELKWLWAVYQNDKELCDEHKPFARNKEYAMKMAEECAKEA